MRATPCGYKETMLKQLSMDAAASALATELSTV